MGNIKQNLLRLESNKIMSNNKVQDYLNHHYKPKYSNDEKGYWIIYGEDRNCDFGGYHYEPLLEIVSGDYLDVVTYAVTLKKFYTWGAGGRIVKTSIIPVDKNTNAEKVKLLREQEELQQKLLEIQDKLGLIKK